VIHGQGVAGKYNIIMEGRRQELFAGVPVADHPAKIEELGQFQSMIRNCTMPEFNEWYDLYKSVYSAPKRRKRITDEDDDE
jgi:hypothetical protein